MSKTLLTVAALAAGFAVAPLPAPSQMPPVAATEVADGIYVISGSVDLIVASIGDDGTLLVNVGYPFAADQVRSAIAEVGGGKPQYIINTHLHHGFANHLFADSATIIAHEQVGRRMRHPNIMGGSLIPAFPEAAWPDTTFSDSLTLHFNGEEIRIVHFPKAHTGGDAVVFFDNSKVVVTGDMFVPHMSWTDYNTGGDFSALLVGIDRLIEMTPEDAVIVPGHDHPVDYNTLIEYRDMLYDAKEHVVGRMAAGLSLPAIQYEGMPHRFARWQSMVPSRMFIESIYTAYSADPGVSSTQTYEYANGLWFNGGAFESKTMYSVRGVFTNARPASIDSTIDLRGGYAIPPLGEAHTHAFSDPSHIEDDVDRFLSEGVFYAMVQDPANYVDERLLAHVNRPTSVDVTYTQGVVTPSWSAIPLMYNMFAGMGRYGEGRTLEDIEGEVIFFVDSVDDLEAKWDQIASVNDDFLKVIVAFADEWEERRNNPAYGAQPGIYSGMPGVSPDVLHALVQRAHAAGLRVSAHIETAADFRLAVEAGVDLIAHLPAAWQIGEETGYSDSNLDRWKISDEDASLARIQNPNAPAVITTTFTSPDDPDFERYADVHRHNLRTLADNSVKLALGSDQFAFTSRAEALYIRDLEVFDDLTILKLLVEQTPQVIFPGRRIGHLREGYEASFLVLESNPIEDLNALASIRLRVKQGQLLR